jgi:RNA polymerase sigma-70 factor, ECF subfamily
VPRKLAESVRILALRTAQRAERQKASHRAGFERLIVPHLPAARKLALWLLRNEQDAEDAVQEACLRALQFFDTFDGRDARKWLLAIVRNTCFTFLHKSRVRFYPLDESANSMAVTGTDPQSALSKKEQAEQLHRGLEALPFEFQQVLELRELKGMSYRQIAELTGLPVGTVMSRLARGRLRLRRFLLREPDVAT